MRNYELVLVLKSNLTETVREKIVNGIKLLLKDAKITTENDWGSKALAYPIKKELTGHYVDIILEIEKIPADLEKKLLTNEDILRYLLVRTK